MLTQPQSGDRGSGASLSRGGLYQMLLGNTDVRENSHNHNTDEAYKPRELTVTEYVSRKGKLEAS